MPFVIAVVLLAIDEHHKTSHQAARTALAEHRLPDPEAPPGCPPDPATRQQQASEPGNWLKYAEAQIPQSVLGARPAAFDRKLDLIWSSWRDLNSRPLDPQSLTVDVDGWRAVVGTALHQGIRSPSCRVLSSSRDGSARL
jgi:hypothetical protein